MKLVNKLIVLVGLSLTACYTPKEPVLKSVLHNGTAVEVRDGDLVFQDLDCGELCDAIEAVTQGVNNYNFSHVGILAVENDTAFVYEAIGKGVQKTVWDSFLVRSNKVVISRLLPEYTHIIEPALHYVNFTLGVPYDEEFILGNRKFYCSEMIYEAFRNATNTEFFELQPMTFKVPNSDTFFTAWENYYQQLQVAIPEGELGLNPGSISRSNKLTVVYDGMQ